MISAHVATQLEERLSQFETQPGHQIVVLKIPSLNGDSLEDFSICVAEVWKIDHGCHGFRNAIFTDRKDYDELSSNS